MDPLVRELASYGLYGRRMSEVPEEILESLVNSPIGEIRTVKDVAVLKKVVIGANLGVDYKEDPPGESLLELHPRSDYVVRLKTEEWRMYVLRGIRSKLDQYFWITSELLTNPNGVPRDVLIEKLDIGGLDLKDRIRRLVSVKAVRIETHDNTRTFFYTWGDEQPQEGAAEEKGKADGDGGKAAVVAKKVDSGTLDANKPDRPSRRNKPRVFSLPGEVLRYASKKKTFVLSEERDAIEKHCPRAAEEDNTAISVAFEKAGFHITEVSSKFMPTEYIVSKMELEESDPQLVEQVELAKNLIISGFRRRIWREIISTPLEATIDNGFFPSFSKRVEVFYSYIISQLPLYSNQMFFGRNAVLQMDFLTFASCVPLEHEGLALAVALCAAEENGQTGLFSICDFVDITNGMSSDPGALYTAARKVLGSVKLLDAVALLNAPPIEELAQYFPQHKECAVELVTKATPRSFKDVMAAVIKYSLFEVHEADKFVFFGLIEGIEEYLETVFQKIETSEGGRGMDHLKQEERWKLFASLCEISQEDFLDAATKIFAGFTEAGLRYRYNRRLRNFSC